MKKILIGGAALKKLGSKRNTKDIDYLVDNKEISSEFYHDNENSIDYCNANGSLFFKEIYNIEKNNEIASPQSLLELKAYAFVQHCLNMTWQKADDCEYDIKFLVRKFNLTNTKIVNKHIGFGQLAEITKVIKDTKI